MSAVASPETRAEVSTAKISDLPDTAFAVIEAGGTKDEDGKTVPRSLRHYPVHDKSHADNAAARAGAALAGDDEDAKALAAKALPKIQAAQKKFNEGSQEKKSAGTPLARRRKERHRAVSLLPEVRFFHPQGLEVREADTEGNLVTIVGMPIVYDTPYQVMDRVGEFTERMMPGVARDVLGGDTRFLFNHDGMPLARTASGTLSLRDQSTGLEIGATLDLRQGLANDLVIAVQRGDVNQMSIGFLCDDDTWSVDRSERAVNHFREMPDVSAVTYPASPTTQLAVAQRMALSMAPEARALTHRLYLDLRSGKTLSTKNQGAIVNAVKALHGVLQDGGLDPKDLLDQKDLEDENTTRQPATEDGSDAGGAVSDAAGPDLEHGEYDPGEKMRSNIPATRAERREAIESPSYDDQRQKVCGALSDYLTDMGASSDIWIMDMGADWVIYNVWQDDTIQVAGPFKLSYSETVDGITFAGAPMRVDQHTEWVPAQERSASTEDDVSARSSSRLLTLRAQTEIRAHRRRQLSLR